MVMFKARYRPMTDRPTASLQAQQQQQPQSQSRRRPQHVQKKVQQQQQQQPPKVPPIEEERGPQNPVREPEPLHEPERVR